LTGALHDQELQLSPLHTSSLASIKLVNPEKMAVKTETERVVEEIIFTFLGQIGLRTYNCLNRHFPGLVALLMFLRHVGTGPNSLCVP